MISFLIFLDISLGMLNCSTLHPANLNQLDNDSVVLLDVSTVLSGSVYPKGEILNLRVYKGGKVEFDDYPPNPFEVNASRKRQRLSSQIDVKDIQEIERIISQMDFSNMEKKYNPTTPHLDSKMTKTITINYNGESKVIQIEENDVVLKLDEKSPYSLTLIRLLDFVDTLNKKLRKL